MIWGRRDVSRLRKVGDVSRLTKVEDVSRLRKVGELRGGSLCCF